MKARAYECLVRPKLEYASAAWNPYTDQDVNRLEQVQKNAARFVCGDYRRTTHSSDLVHHLGWDTLEHRRLLHQASMFYKIRNGLVRIEFPKCVTPSLRETKPHNYQQLKSNILSYSYSFFPRTIRVWNVQVNSACAWGPVSNNVWSISEAYYHVHESSRLLKRL